MAYVSIYFGIILGYVLRIVRPFIPKKKAEHKNYPAIIANKVIGFVNQLLRFLQTLIHGFTHLIINIWKRIVAFFLFVFSTIRIGFLYLWNTLRNGYLNLKASIQRRWLIMVQRFLAHDNVYIMAKTAKVYSYPGNTVRLLYYNSIKEHCRKTKEKYIVLEEAQKRPVCLPAFFEMEDEKIEEYLSPEIYLADLSNITVTGGSSILLSNRECLYDPFIMDTDHRLDIKFSNVLGEVGDKIIVELKTIKRVIPEAIFLMGFASYNYYHFTIEIMSRLRYVDSYEEYQHLPILVDKVMTQIPQFMELLDRFNINKHPIIVIGSDETLLVKKLIYPSANTWMPINVKERELIRTQDFLMARSGLENIRSYIPEIPVLASRKIFISRRNLTTTRLGNEGIISKLFEKNGFEIVYTEGMTYEQQVTLFRGAVCVAAASGAALTNMVYCQPGTKIICIIPKEYRFFMYSTMAYLLGLCPVFLDAKVTERTAYTASDVFELDQEYCERFLETLQ